MIAIEHGLTAWQVAFSKGVGHPLSTYYFGWLGYNLAPFSGSRIPKVELRIRYKPQFTKLFYCEHANIAHI